MKPRPTPCPAGLRRFVAITACAGQALLGTLAASAAEYHVNRKHAAASDENPGSADKPFATIAAAAKALKPGDRVWVHAGVYREQVEFEAEATDWLRPTVLASWPGDDVVVKGSDVVTGWEPHRGSIWKRTGWAHNSQLVFADGELLQQIGGLMVDYLVTGNRWKGRVGNTLEDMTAGSFYVDLDSDTLYVWLKDGGDPNEATVEVSVRPFLLVAKGSYFLVEGIHFSHSNTAAKVNWPAVRISGSHIVFRNNRVTWADFIGLGINGSYIEVADSQFNYCGNSGIGGNCYRGCRLLRNETSYNNWRKWSTGWHAGGFKLIPIHRHLLIEGHRAFHNQADGMWIDSLDSSNITINGCESAYNQGNGLHYEIGQRGVVTNNLFHHNTGRGIYLSSSSEMLVAHNVCYANGMSGIVSHGVARKAPVERHPKGIVPARNNRIVGNIMMDNLNPELKPEGWSYRPELILPNPDKEPDLFGGCFSDCNVYFRSDGRKIPFWYVWGERIWHSLESWQNDTGNDRHSVIADPLFVDAAGGNFRLREGSPAIGLAPILGEVGDDCEGSKRPSRGEGQYRCAGIYTVPEDLNPPRKPVAIAETAPAPASAAPTTPDAPADGVLKAPDPAKLKLRDIPLPPDSSGPLGDAHDPLLKLLGVSLRGAHFHAGGMLFDLDNPPNALVLDSQRRAATVTIDSNAAVLYMLVALRGDGEVALNVARGDGTTQSIALVPGKTIPDSFGTLTADIDRDAIATGSATWSVAWQGTVAQGMEARLWLITYVNDNHWLPVLRLECRTDGDATAAILALRAGTR